MIWISGVNILWMTPPAHERRIRIESLSNQEKRDILWEIEIHDPQDKSNDPGIRPCG